MKILFVHYDWRYGGAAIAGRRLAKAIMSTDNDVIFYDWRGVSDHQGNLIKKNTLLLRIISRFILPLVNRLFFYAFFKRRPMCLSILSWGHSTTINNIGADICHLHWTQNEFLSLREIRKLRRVVITAHDYCGQMDFST